jgi:hypothetical protein
LLPNLEGKGVGSPVEKGMGAVVEGMERGNNAAALDPDEVAVEEISWELAGQLVTQIVPGQRKSWSIQRF